MRLDTEVLEYKILKHFLTYPEAIIKAQNLRITPEHFTFVPEGFEKSYDSFLCDLAYRYFNKSNGCLVTKTTLDQSILDFKMKKKAILILELIWSNIQEQECIKDELFGLLEQLKVRKVLRIWEDTLVKGQETLEEEGIDKGIEYISAAVSKMYSERTLYESPVQEFDIADLKGFRKEYEKRKNNPDKYRGIKCGYSEIDKRTQGFFPGQIVAFIGASGAGKSTHLLNVAVNAHMQEKNVLYFSFEMDSWTCKLRHISLMLDVDYDAIKGLNLTDEQLDGIMIRLNSMSGAYFHYDTNSEDPTPEYVESKIRELSASKGHPDVVVIDYLGNMTTRNAKSSQKQHEKQGDAIREIHRFAKNMNVLVYTAQQMNRGTITEQRKTKAAGKTIEFQQDAAAGSQELINAAWYIIGLESHKDNGENMVTFHAVKMRDVWFPPFGAKVLQKFNKVLELSDAEQIEWRINRGVLDPDSFKKTDENGKTKGSDHYNVVESDKGEKVVDWGTGEQAYSEDDLKFDVDDWNNT